MRQAQWFETKNFWGQLLIIKLHRSIYGFRQSLKVWNGATDGNLRIIDSLPPRVYVKGNGDNHVMLKFGVDDLLITKRNKNTVAKVRKPLIMNKFAMAEFGDAIQMLGIGIILDTECGTIRISRGLYMTDYRPFHAIGIDNKLTVKLKGSIPSSKEDTIYCNTRAS